MLTLTHEEAARMHGEARDLSDDSDTYGGYLAEEKAREAYVLSEQLFGVVEDEPWMLKATPGEIHQYWMDRHAAASVEG